MENGSEPLADPKRFLVEIPHKSAVDRWSGDANVGMIAR